MKQLLFTPAAGKRLIAKALAQNPTVLSALKNGTLVIVAGTTNGYVAEEILKILKIEGFSKSNFFRGLTLPPGGAVTSEGRLTDESKFPGDAVIIKGEWQKGKTIVDVVDSLKERDVILKGANALNIEKNKPQYSLDTPKPEQYRI